MSLFIRLNIGAYVSRSSPHSCIYHGERLCSVSLFIRLNIGAYVPRSPPHSSLYHSEGLCSVSLFIRLNIGAYVPRSSPHSSLYHSEGLCSVSLFIRLNIGAYVPRSPPHSSLYHSEGLCSVSLFIRLNIGAYVPRSSPHSSLYHSEGLCSVSLFIRLNIGAYVPRSPPHSSLYHSEGLCSVSLFLCMNISTYVRKPPPPLDEYHTTNSHSYSEVRYLSELSFFVFFFLTRWRKVTCCGNTGEGLVRIPHFLHFLQRMRTTSYLYTEKGSAEQLAHNRMLSDLRMRCSNRESGEHDSGPIYTDLYNAQGVQNINVLGGGHIGFTVNTHLQSICRNLLPFGGRQKSHQNVMEPNINKDRPS